MLQSWHEREIWIDYLKPRRRLRYSVKERIFGHRRVGQGYTMEKITQRREEICFP
jgi:hypothetical protein